MNQTNPSFLLTIDVEDWFQVENLRPWFPPSNWDLQELRVEQNTNHILDLLDSITLSCCPENPRATFFVLAWIAERLPGLIRDIQKRGHEVASHGCNHLMCNELCSADLRQDLIHSKQTIEDIIGAEVKGYRAPNFSISDHTLELIKDSGYIYDSSYNNFSRHGRYGKMSMHGCQLNGAAYKMDHCFHELPITNLTLRGRIIPWGGGGYFRLLPLSVFKAGVKRILNKTSTYMLYLHPWEIDPGQPRLVKTRNLATWKHYVNLDKTRSRLENLISSFDHCTFPTCSKYLDDVAAAVMQVPNLVPTETGSTPQTL